LFFKSDICESGRMKMQVFRSVALLALTSPMLFAASPTPQPAREIGVNLALRDLAVKPGDDRRRLDYSPIGTSRFHLHPNPR
jgi:hypothetical protein